MLICPVYVLPKEGISTVHSLVLITLSRLISFVSTDLAEDFEDKRLLAKLIVL